ncbi:MAG: TlpA family protein disulfide reductase [Candidatus Sumerlaeaceae bacterium]
MGLSTRWVLLVGGAVLLGTGYFGGYMTATNDGQRKFNRSHSYMNTYEVQEMVKSMEDLRAAEKDRGLYRLDRLMLHKLDGLTYDNPAPDYDAKRVTAYFERVYGEPGLNGDRQISQALVQRLETGLRPPAMQLAAGDAAPDFELTTADGTQFQLSERKGRVVLLTFFATWCAGCVEELDHWKMEAAGLFDHEGMDVLVIGVDDKESAAKLLQFAERRAYSFKFAQDTMESNVFGKYARKHNISGEVIRSIPLTVLIDKEGKTIEIYEGFTQKEYDRLKTNIKEALGSPPGHLRATGP